MIQPDSELGFAPRASATTRRSHLDTGVRYEIFTDARGVRIDAPGAATPATVDLVTVGGSFAYGHGIPNQATFTSRLSRSLELRAANLSFGSFGTVQSAVLLERHADLEPRLVIYALIEDHLRRNLAPCAPSYSPYCLPVAHVAFDDPSRPRLRGPRVELFSAERNRAFYNQVLMRDGFGWDDIFWRAKLDLFRLRESRQIGYEDTPDRRRRALRFLLERMVAVTHRLGAQLLVVYIPTPLSGPYRPLPMELRQAIEGLELSFLDAGKALAEATGAPPAEALVLHPHDRHPSARAHEILAVAIEEAVIDRALLDRPELGGGRPEREP